MESRERERKVATIVMSMSKHAHLFGQDVVVGMLDADVADELISNLTQLMRHVYQPLVQNLLYFADDSAAKKRIYEEVLMAAQSLLSSLKVVALLLFPTSLTLSTCSTVRLSSNRPLRSVPKHWTGFFCYVGSFYFTFHPEHKAQKKRETPPVGQPTSTIASDNEKSGSLTRERHSEGTFFEGHFKVAPD